MIQGVLHLVPVHVSRIGIILISNSVAFALSHFFHGCSLWETMQCFTATHNKALKVRRYLHDDSYAGVHNCTFDILRRSIMNGLGGRTISNFVVDSIFNTLMFVAEPFLALGFNFLIWKILTIHRARKQSDSNSVVKFEAF
ncbi:unnamed protein product [Sphenostylis stenocarpa]|uniref:Uncharacterized protein n=1 Tax=Sphenostylis stenocarpa TaxID=92480 RepID=A0AA86RXM5_9FABA|nr:unnamed protein product [Sphenostylis stenocarpa]